MIFFNPDWSYSYQFVDSLELHMYGFTYYNSSRIAYITSETADQVSYIASFLYTCLDTQNYFYAGSLCDYIIFLLFSLGCQPMETSLINYSELVN